MIRSRALGAFLAISLGTFGLAFASACGDDAKGPATAVSSPVDGNTEAAPTDGARPSEASADGGPTDAAAKVTCSKDPCATGLAVGEGFGCVVMGDRTVHCWGSNQSGQLARLDADGGSAPSSAAPVAIPGLSDVVDLVGGASHVCARTGAGKVYCWGENTLHQASTADATVVATPSEVALPSPAERLTLGAFSTCALLSDGRVFCWGYSQASSLGVDDASVDNYRVVAPTPMIGVAHPDLIGTYMNTTCVANDGGLRCLGFHALGAADAGHPASIPEAKPLALPGRVAILSSGLSDAVCVALDTGATMCWGSNVAGETDPTSTGNVDSPRPVGVSGATALHGTGAHTCALTNGEVWCWGSNDTGQLGAGAPVNPSATHLGPIRVNLAGRAVAIGAGSKTSCALLETGVVQCWGSNERFALGRGDAGPEAGAVDPVAAPVTL